MALRYHCQGRGRKRDNGKCRIYLYVSLYVQLRGQHRRLASGTNVSAKPKSARDEDISAISQTKSAALQDLRDEVKQN